METSSALTRLAAAAAAKFGSFARARLIASSRLIAVGTADAAGTCWACNSAGVTQAKHAAKSSEKNFMLTYLSTPYNQHCETAWDDSRARPRILRSGCGSLTELGRNQIDPARGGVEGHRAGAALRG